MGMRSKKGYIPRGGGGLWIGLLLTMLAWSSAHGAGYSIERIPAAALPIRTPDGASSAPALSADGRYLAFLSTASNLVPGDTPDADIFVRDLTTGVTELVSLSTEGVGATATNASGPAISADGRYIAFVSDDSQLVPNDTNFSTDVFVRDRVAGITERVSLREDGTEATSSSAGPVSISADGRYVCINTSARLATGDTDNWSDTYIRDRVAGTTELVSVAADGLQTTKAPALEPRMSADGRFVVFRSSDSTFVPNDTNACDDIFLRDRTSRTTERVSLTTGGGEADAESHSPDVSADGRYVCFNSSAPNLNPLTGTAQVYVRDRQTGVTEIVSLTLAGTPSDLTHEGSRFSGDGRWVAFQSSAADLVPGDTNGLTDLFVRDRQNAVTERVSISSSGQQANYFLNRDFALSMSGGHVAFVSRSQNLAPEVLDTSTPNVFVRDRAAGTTVLGSIGVERTEAFGASAGPGLSSSGRWVAFTSAAPNLVAGDSNGVADTFTYDRQLGTTERVGLGVDDFNNQFNFGWISPSVSADGRFVAFASPVTNPDLGDPPNSTDVFVRDRQSGTTELVSVGAMGAQAFSSSLSPSISANGRYVAFISFAANLVAGDSNGVADGFVFDRTSHTMERISLSTAGAQAGAATDSVSVSADGRWVAFATAAANLVPGDTNNTADIFVRDRQSGTTERVSVANGTAVQANSVSMAPAVSGDGRYVAFWSAATNLTSGVAEFRGIYVRDRALGTTTKLTEPRDGVPRTTYTSQRPAISASGRYVAFAWEADGLVAGDTNDAADVFVRDLAAGTMARVSLTTAGGEANASSRTPAISADGRIVAFVSAASNLVPGDGNLSEDVFVAANPIWDATPTARPDSYSVVTGQTLTVTAPGVLANDTDPAGAPLTAVPGLAPAHGTLSLQADGAFSYAPAAGYVGADGFTYRAGNGSQTSLLATVSIAVLSAPPTISDVGDNTTTEDVATAAIPFVIEDADTPLASLTVSGNSSNTTLVPGGSFVFGGSGANRTVVITPAPNQSGTATITLTVSDGGSSASDTFVLTVTPIDDPPLAQNDGYSTPEDTLLTVAAPGVLSNDADPEGSPLAAAMVSGPGHGTLSLAAGGGFTYQPAANYHGPDSFTYRVSDGGLMSAPATVSLVVSPVNDVPTANPQSVTTPEDTARSITLTGSDPDGDSLTYAIVAAPAHGTLSGTGAVRTYQPTANYHGPDSFTYRVNDGTAVSDPATVSLTITPVNDPPVAQNDSYSVPEDTPLTVSAPGVLSNDNDAEGSPLTAMPASEPAHGTLFLAPGGGFTYTPEAGYHGPDSFTYRAGDGVLTSVAATVSITVTPVNDVPTVSPQSVSTPEDTARGITLTADDADGDPLTYTILAQPAHGMLSGSGAGRTYTPTANYYGPDSFTYRVGDGVANSGTATVSITVTPVNDPPSAARDAYTINRNLVLSVAAPGVLQNDGDVEGDPLAAVLLAPPTHGTVSLAGAGGFTYTPTPGYSGPDAFTYRAGDGSAESAPATVALTVTDNNNPPVASDVTLDLDEDTARLFDLPFVDPDGGSLTYFIVTAPSHGKLTGSGSSRTYQPNLNYSGPDTMVVLANDGSAVSGRATITFNVKPVNDTPTANAGADRVVNATAPLTPVSLDGSTSSDVEPGPLAYAWTWNGSVVGAAAIVTVSLPPGEHSLLLTVTDGGGAVATDMVTITVRDVTLPSLTCPADLTVPAATAGGAVVGFVVTATDAVSTASVTSNPASGTVFPMGATVVTCTATDAAGNQASCTFRVTVVTPTTTPGKVKASGMIPVAGGSAKFSASVISRAGRPLKGSVSFTDPVTRKALKSKAVTAVVITGTRARIFGTMRLASGATVGFLAEAEDLGATPGSDRFRLELSDGRVWGAASLTKGAVTITH